MVDRCLEVKASASLSVLHPVSPRSPFQQQHSLSHLLLPFSIPRTKAHPFMILNSSKFVPKRMSWRFNWCLRGQSFQDTKSVCRWGFLILWGVGHKDADGGVVQRQRLRALNCQWMKGLPLWNTWIFRPLVGSREYLLSLDDGDVQFHDFILLSDSFKNHTIQNY